jgi:hypothetical protein
MVVGDQQPLPALALLEDVRLDHRRVVHDEQDLRLGVEVGAGAQEELIDFEAARCGHGVGSLLGGTGCARARRGRCPAAAGSATLDLD